MEQIKSLFGISQFMINSLEGYYIVCVCALMMMLVSLRKQFF